MTREEEVRTFMRYGLPGMTLMSSRRELVKRCACGRQISGNKARCMACQTEVLKELASQIDGQDLLDSMLARSFPEARQEMLNALRPYLSFTPGPLKA